MDRLLHDQWQMSRSGARSGRGYRYQDAVGALDVCLAWIDRTPVTITPEGWEDYTVEPEFGPPVHRQVKSRQYHLGPFTPGEVAKFINAGWARHAQRLLSQPEARFELILERNVRGFPNSPVDPLAETDLGEALLPLLGVAEVGAERMLALTSVRIEPDPIRKATDALSAALSITPAASVPIVQAVRTHIGEVADANANRSPDDRGRIGLTDAERVIIGTRGMIEAERLEGALDQGLVEPVDWSNPVHDDHFYEGVDVVPGHIVSGLALDRPALVESINDALDDSRFVLIAGPSGCGKSALAWLVAHRRRAMPCYRIRRLYEADVEVAIRFAKALLPTETSPVTFVVDDLGRASLDGFDHFVREALIVPGVSVLGTVRNENLLLIREAHRAAIIRPTLDDELAARLFGEISNRSATTWPHWREPLEQSDGLLLEYTHILTRGERLSAVVEAQVQERVREGRTAELHILALVGMASATGANVPWRCIEDLVEGAADEVTRALRRLIDEHLVVQSSDGLLSGLHQLRSSAAETAVHRSPPFTRARTLRELVATLPGSELLQLLVAAMADGEEEVLIEALTQRLNKEADVEVLAAALQGLRLAGFNAEAATWVEVATEHQVPPGLAPLVFNLALAEADLDNLPIDERVSEAVTEITTLPRRDDHRAALVGGIGPDRVIALLTPDLDPVVGAPVLSALDGLAVVTSAPSWPPTGFVSNAVGSGPLPLLASILDAVTRIDRETAISAVSLEMEGAILRRIERETAWLRNLSIQQVNGSTIASCIWVNVVDPPNQTVHDVIVDIARTICWCLPRIDEVHIRAVFPDGDDAAIGDFTVASKRLKRAVLVSDDQVRWNRARLAAGSALIAVPSASARLAAEASLIDDALSIASEFGRVWVTGKGDLRSVNRRRQELVERAHMLGPPPISGVEVFLDPASDKEFASPLGGDVGDSVAVDIAKFILPGLRSAANLRATASVIGRQINRLDEALTSSYWELIGLSEPPPAVGALRETLDDLQAIAFGLANSDVRPGDIRKAGLAGSAQAALSRAATLARARSQRRFERELRAFVELLRNRDVHVDVVEGSGDPAAPWWPITEVGLLVRVQHLLEWFSALAAITSVIPEELNTRGVSITPLRDDRLVAGLAGRLINGKWFEAPDSLERLRDADLPPRANTPAADAFSRATSSLITISALVAWDTPSHTHPAEEAALADAQQAYREAVAYLQGLDQENPVIQEVMGALAQISERVQNEIDNSVDLDQTLAAELSRAIRGSSAEESESVNAIRGAYVFLLEWDIDRANALALLERLA